MRSREVEKDFIKAISGRVYLAPPMWGKLVQERLEQGEREYKNKSYRLPTSQLMGELAAEPIDAVAWATLPLTNINERFHRPDEVRDYLESGAAHCIRAWEEFLRAAALAKK